MVKLAEGGSAAVAVGAMALLCFCLLLLVLLSVDVERFICVLYGFFKNCILIVEARSIKHEA